VSPETQARVRALATTEAARAFPVGLNNEDAGLEPEAAWNALNAAFPANLNVEETGDGFTEMDLLFRDAYRLEMAKRWLAECERRLGEGRRAIQVAHHAGVTVALCNDGTIMQWKSGQVWTMLPEVPQWEPAP
jgi:hypothetical protein